LTKPVLAPLGTAELILVIENHGRVGEFNATCDVLEESGKWTQKFSVDAIGLGSAFPATAIEWRKKADTPGRRLHGLVVTGMAESKVEVTCKARLPDAARDALVIGQCRVTNRRRLRDCYEHAVEIDLERNQELIDDLAGPLDATLVIDIACPEFRQQQVIPMVLAAKWSGL
jgi:hypothetical protein